MIIRPIAPKDLDALFRIAEESGPGFTSLMPDRDALARKIDHSVDSFQRTLSAPGDEYYLFVLEDTATGAVMGTTGIQASVGRTHPLYHFRHSTLVQHSRNLGLHRQIDTLTRCQHYTGCTEICSLYLRPEYRRPLAGKLLSRVRFLFMAMHPERFSDTVIAEMRGVSDEGGQSPFWNCLKTHFADLEFASVTSLVGAGHTEFIEDLIPDHPIYTSMLSAEARGVVGKVHEQTRPALAMLEAEGFRFRGLVDVFDGGPTVECPLASIRSVRASRGLRTVAIGQPEAAGTPTLVANTGLADFRATVTSDATNAGKTVLMSPTLSRQLGLNNGAPVQALAMGNTRPATHPEHIAMTPEKHYAH